MVFFAYLVASLFNMMVAPALFKLSVYLPLLQTNIVSSIIILLMISNIPIDNIDKQALWMSTFIMNGILAVGYCNDVLKGVRYDKLLNTPLAKCCSKAIVSITMLPYISIARVDNKYEGILLYIIIWFLYSLYNRFLAYDDSV